jgi:uncharacterized iron-regulated protein
MNLSRTLLAAAAMVFLVGYASNNRPTVDTRMQAAVADPASLTLLRSDGAVAAWDEMIAECARADAVLIGECHGMEVGQAFQAKFFRDLLAEAPGASGALEFFERDEQAALDDYLGGVSNEQEFRRAARRTDSNDTFGHRAIVEACKAAGRPVSAANAPRRYVRIARQEGFDHLRGFTPEQQRLFVVPEFVPTGRYYEDFFEVMGAKNLLEPSSDGAAADPKKAEADDRRRKTIDDMFRSQSMWDWTMADSVAREMDRGGRPVVLIVGRFHTDHDGGLVQALRHMRPGAKIVTISSVNEWAKELGEDEKGIADFVVFIGE